MFKQKPFNHQLQQQQQQQPHFKQQFKQKTAELKDVDKIAKSGTRFPI